MALKFEIKKHLGTLSIKENGWRKELNYISWNDRPEKFDIREWNEDHERMSKGITLTKEELINLKEILNSIDLKD